MEKEQLVELCAKLNIDETVKKSAIQQFTEISRNTILDVSIRGYKCRAFYMCTTPL